MSVTVHNLNNLGREREKNRPLNCHQKTKETWISRISRFSKKGLKTIIHTQLTQSLYLVNGAEAELKCTVIMIQKRRRGKTKTLVGLPRCPVVETLPSNAGGKGSISDWDLRSHMPQGVVKIFKNRDTIDNRRAIWN